MNMINEFYSVNENFEVIANDKFEAIKDITDFVVIDEVLEEIRFREGASNEDGKTACLSFNGSSMVYSGSDHKGVEFAHVLHEMNSEELFSYVNETVREWFETGFY